MLSQSRLVAIGAMTILSMVPIFIIYEEWVRHFVDSIAALFLPDGICSSADNFLGCDRAIEVYRFAEKLGYGIYSALFYFGSSFFITKLLVNDREFNFREAIIFYTTCILMPFTVSYALGSPIESILYHFILIYSGFVLCLFYLKTKRNNKMLHRSV